MQEIILYTQPGCGRCNVIKLKLKKKNIEFKEIENLEKAIEVGKAHDINGTPILQVDDKFLDFDAARHFIDEVK